MVLNRRPPSTRRPARAATAVRRAVEALESRRMMTAVTSLSQLASQEQVTTAVGPVLADTATPANNSISLAGHFTDPLVPGTVVTFATTEGNVVVALTDQATPNTVADFLNYVNAGGYNGTIFHRSVNFTTNDGGSASAPADIIQGGGYNLSGGSIAHINTNAAVADEYPSETFGDLAGTIALAKTGDANSGTSEFFFNVHDNTAALDTPTTDANGQATSYTAFGAVLSGQDTTVTTIAELPTANVSTSTASFPDLPLQGVTAAQISSGSYSESNLVFTNSATAAAGTIYTVASDDPTLVMATVANGVLSFAYGAGKAGVADVTVTATNYDKTTASTTFAVTVPGAAATPTAAAYTAPTVVAGQSVTFDPLSADTSTAAAAFDPATETITVAPAHGTATVDPTSGRITFTPAAGYTGADALTYTIADTAGAVSNPAVVTLAAVPTAAVVSLGGTNPSVINLTEPDGATATIRIVNATGTFTFADYRVTATKVGAAYNVTGAGATLDAISLADDKRIALSSLFITSSKPISVATIFNNDAMNEISAPTTTVTGSLTVSGGHSGGVSYVSLAALTGATVNLVNRTSGTNLVVPTITDTTVSVGTLVALQTGSVTAADPAAHPFTAINISKLTVTGTFAVPLTLTGTGYDVIVANVVAPAAAWNFSGSIYHANITNPTAAWNVNAAGVVQNLKVTGNLTSTVEVAAINQASVTGNLSGAVVQTTAAFNARSTNLRSLKVGGTIDSSVIFAAGNIGTVSAGAISGSRIYAGVTLATASAFALPTATTDLTADAKLTAVLLPTGGSFASTEVAADQIGTLRLGTVAVTAGGTAFGVAGQKIASLRATVGSTPLTLAGPQLKTAATLAAYVAANKGTLDNFTISLF